MQPCSMLGNCISKNKELGAVSTSAEPLLGPEE
jgi:hypothetical protein